jgi:hypothetical protein
MEAETIFRSIAVEDAMKAEDHPDRCGACRNAEEVRQRGDSASSSRVRERTAMAGRSSQELHVAGPVHVLPLLRDGHLRRRLRAAVALSRCVLF